MATNLDVAVLKRVPIVYDGETVGYRYYSVGTGLLGADQFIGYKFIKKESS
uniref:Uncharacterized protein n=1 Tax=viral metagenome TaxID=1070528 RepID=A0A6M3LGC6_9ZZZZ